MFKRHAVLGACPNLKKLLLATVSVMVASAGSTALAQEAGANEVDELVVTGSIVGSQRAAIAEQRNAENLVSVIAADTVGQFPDQNSAAALARIPSVAVQRDQGQERYIQVRGAPNRWTSVSIDGINAIGVDEGGGQRAFRFDAVPAVILSALEVNKSLTPDLSAEAIVARVNLRTFSPFDKAGFALSGDVAQEPLPRTNLASHSTHRPLILPQRRSSGNRSPHWSATSFGRLLALGSGSSETHAGGDRKSTRLNSST